MLSSVVEQSYISCSHCQESGNIHTDQYTLGDTGIPTEQERNQTDSALFRISYSQYQAVHILTSIVSAHQNLWETSGEGTGVHARRAGSRAHPMALEQSVNISSNVRQPLATSYQPL